MSKFSNINEEIKKAQKLLKGIAERTPIVKCYDLSSENREVFIKLENLQRTGSFKIRGAFMVNKILTSFFVRRLTEEESEAIKQKLIEDAERLSPEARKIVVDAMTDKQA